MFRLRLISHPAGSTCAMSSLSPVYALSLQGRAGGAVPNAGFGQERRRRRRESLPLMAARLRARVPAVNELQL